MDVITTARELGKAIQQDERFIRMMAAQQTNDDDEQLQKLIGDFNLKRVDLNSEVSKAERDQEKVARLNEEIRDLYNKIMSNQSMAAFNTAKNEMDAMVEYVMEILRGSISGENPDLIQEPQAGCSGSCSTCGGCH
ncbi:YlbF family regulator [Anaerotruncus sp. X29]|nr:YlbF family regulator [Anaerotruncus sp. X29]